MKTIPVYSIVDEMTGQDMYVLSHGIEVACGWVGVKIYIPTTYIWEKYKITQLNFIVFVCETNR